MLLVGVVGQRFFKGFVFVKVKGRRWLEGNGVDLCVYVCVSCVWVQMVENLNFF